MSFEWLIDPNNGPCGQIPSNSSAMCVVTTWQGSTLDEDFPPGTDNNTVAGTARTSRTAARSEPLPAGSAGAV